MAKLGWNPDFPVEWGITNMYRKSLDKPFKVGGFICFAAIELEKGEIKLIDEK